MLTATLSAEPGFGKGGAQFMLPHQDGRFAFCSAFLGGDRRLLVALQREVGRFWVYRPNEAIKWKSLEGTAGADALPAWSWALTLDSTESSMCIPTEQGPAWLTFNWATNSVHAEHSAGQSIGAPVRVDTYILAPVKCEGRFSVVCRKKGDSTWSECVAGSDPGEVISHLQRNRDQEPYMGIPVVDEMKNIAYWPCRGGYVRVSVTNPTKELRWEFRTWDTDKHPATALIELGPPYRKTGSRSGFWQLCEDHDPLRRDGTVNKIVKFDGHETADSEVLEYGQFVSTGRASFSWLYDFWTDVNQLDMISGEQRELRYPLLQFGEKGLVLMAKVQPWKGRDDMGLFSETFFNRMERASVFVRFVIEGSGTPERALYAEGVDGGQSLKGSLFRVPLEQLANLSVFVYDARLYIYFPEDNRAFGWPLELAEA